MTRSHGHRPAEYSAVTFLLVFVLAALAPAQTFTTLYNFTGGSDGGEPYAGVIQDASGNLYGTAYVGSNQTCPHGGCGAVFELNTAGIETVLHSFSGLDGENPETPVVRDSKGNIYGTTTYGGSSNNCSSIYNGCGVVFKIDSAGNESVLYSFTGELDGCWPEQGLVRGKAGILYGTTSWCGASGWGTIFKIDSAGSFTLLHSFAGPPSDGADPWLGHLMMDKFGNLYGVTTEGGAYGYGLLYKLSKDRTFRVLYSFTGIGMDGCEPWGSVVEDKAGNLYGTTYWCGSNGSGTIWKVNKKGKGITLHGFAGGESDGCHPNAGVALDPKGHLYGVTSYCGVNNYGVLYRWSAKGGLTLLHSFDLSDGALPYGEVLRTSKGTLFGTTVNGGTYPFYGTVWSYVP